MLRSKKIDDYLEAELGDFKPGIQLPVDIHLYFSSNRHILVWRKGGEAVSEAFLEKYRSRGMRKVWIHRDDSALWQQYLKGREPVIPIMESEYIRREQNIPVMEAAPIEKKPAPRTEEGQKINETLQTAELSDRHKTALVARAARGLLAETVRPENPALQREAREHAREAVKDILDSALEEAPQDLRRSINELWKLGSTEEGLDHAVNVASLAVLFALSFGRIGQELLVDIALAALMHDLGLTQIPTDVVQTPWSDQRGPVLQRYSRHVDEGLRLLGELGIELSARVRPLIQQHHEKFDGSGYPTQLQGFQVNDIAQLIAMADAVESMASGQWDGQPRTLLETFVQLELLERNRSHPEYFNPQVFSAVMRWIRDPASLSGKLKAGEIVRMTSKELLKKKASA